MTKTGFQDALAEILGVSPGALRENDDRESVASWTSIADVQIFTLIASEFGIEPDAELLEADRIGDLVGVLEARRAFAS